MAGRASCPRCGSTETTEAPGDMPYWCPDCRRRFSVRIATSMERSKVPLRKWVFAIYLEMTSLKGVSSMKLHRDLKVTQKTAWFMLHRIREAWAQERAALFSGPVEVDETYIGGLRKNMPKSKRAAMDGRGTVGKTAVVGANSETVGAPREDNQSIIKQKGCDTGSVLWVWNCCPCSGEAGSAVAWH